MKLLLATRNRHKVDEIQAILGLEPGSVRCAADFPHVPDVEEDGPTFEANAVKKAQALLVATGEWSLADDSGLEVDALGGVPGVLSARYAGEPVNHAANIAKLLKALEGRSDRRARFRCVLALAGPDGSLVTVSGSCEGTIALAPRGEGGFGYDPVFVPEGHDRTFAEMGADEKNAMSHRGRALEKLKDALGRLHPGP